MKNAVENFTRNYGNIAWGVVRLEHNDYMVYPDGTIVHLNGQNLYSPENKWFKLRINNLYGFLSSNGVSDKDIQNHDFDSDDYYPIADIAYKEALKSFKAFLSNE